MILTVLYPAKPQARFDLDCYTSTHLPLVREVMAPASIEVSHGVGALDVANFTNIAPITLVSEAVA